MSTTSITFLAFASACALLCAIWQNRVWQNVVMLTANLLFLASFTTSAKAYAPYLAFLMAGYVAVVLVQRTQSRWMMGLAVTTLLLGFCWLKQYWFLSFAHALAFPYATIGLSYVFFRVVALVIDSRTDDERPQVGPISYFNFAMNFATLVAGPIDRYQNFSEPYQRPSLAVVGYGVERIILGLFKVIALSTLVGAAQSDAAAQIASATGGDRIWQAAVALGIYPIYLYFNFSGYSDIVIGFGRLLGKVYPENFNAPFVATSFLDFWTRWHMSLSNWLRDYVYTPLLMALMTRVRTKGVDAYLGVISYFVTFFIIGIWHGSTVIFAIYGLLLALGVSVNKLYQLQMAQRLGKKEYKALAARPAYRIWGRATTYTWYCLCMLCFWATGEQALQVIDRLGVAGLLAMTGAIFVPVCIASAVYELSLGVRLPAGKPLAFAGVNAAYLRASLAGVLTFFCIASVMLSQGKTSSIIYQAF